jgi:hypothetical protein
MYTLHQVSPFLVEVHDEMDGDEYHFADIFLHQGKWKMRLVRASFDMEFNTIEELVKHYGWEEALAKDNL